MEKNSALIEIFGAYINGLAGEIGVEELNEISLISRDTIINIPKAIKIIKES